VRLDKFENTSRFEDLFCRTETGFFGKHRSLG
jgi:hypothetical protein